MESEKLISKEKLNSLLTHPLPNVRLDAVRALQKFFYNEAGISEAILDAAEILGPREANTITSALRCFLPSAEDIRRIAGLYNRAMNDPDPFSENLLQHLEWALLRAPFELLTENRTALAFNHHLRGIYENAKQNKAAAERGPDYLWGKLIEFCESRRGLGLWGNDLRYGKFLTDSLKKYPEKIRARVILNLNKDKNYNYHFEEYLIELSGELRIREAVPELFRRLMRSSRSESLQPRCVRSLGMIGGADTANLVKSYYISSEDEKMYLPDVLGYMPDSAGITTLMKLVKEENDPAWIIYLARAVFSLFSREGTLTVRDKMLSLGMESTVHDLEPSMMAVWAYHDQD